LINFSGILPGVSLSLNGAQLTLDHVTVQGSANGSGINVGSGSQLGFSVGAPSVVTGNFEDGINVGAGGFADIANVTISNNGRTGIHVTGGSINLANTIFGNDAPVEVTGNGTGNFGDTGGVLVEAGSLSAKNGDGPVPIHIHHNTGVGLAVFGSTADMEANVTFDGNTGDPDSVPSTELRSLFSAHFGTRRRISPGGPGGGAVSAIFNSNVILASGNPFHAHGRSKIPDRIDGVSHRTRHVRHGVL